MIKRAQFYFENFSMKVGYGKGFWALVAGLGLASVILVKMEMRHSPSPVVERLPASETFIH